MFDVELRMEDRSADLARMGEALGRAGVSVEGGGLFLVGGVGVAYLLVDDPVAGRRVRDAWQAARPAPSPGGQLG